MKTPLITLLTVLSLLCLLAAGLLLGMHFTQPSPGMVLLFFMPLLAAGLVLGGLALLLQRAWAIVPTGVLAGLRRVHLVLLVLGVVALVYTFFE